MPKITRNDHIFEKLVISGDFWPIKLRKHAKKCPTLIHLVWHCTWRAYLIFKQCQKAFQLPELDKFWSKRAKNGHFYQIRQLGANKSPIKLVTIQIVTTGAF